MTVAKRGRTLFITALVLSAVVCTSQAQQPRFIPVTDAVLQDPQPADWLGWRRESGGNGFSPLDQVIRENVGDLRLAWSWAMAGGLQHPEPIAQWEQHSDGFCSRRLTKNCARTDVDTVQIGRIERPGSA